MLTGFPRTRWQRRGFSKSYAVRISVKISRICQFRLIMEIMTGLLGCWTNNTLAAGHYPLIYALPSVKPQLMFGYEWIIRSHDFA